MKTPETTSSKANSSKEKVSSKETVSSEVASMKAAARNASAKDSISRDGMVGEAGSEITGPNKTAPVEKSTERSRVDPLTLVDDSYWPARALRSLRESRFSEAISLCDAGLKDDDPAPISGFLIKAQALASLGRLKDSLSTLTDALRVDPENQMAFKLLGDIHFAEGEEEAAMSYYRRIYSQRAQKETIGIALEIGTPLSAALKKVFMSRTPGHSIELSTEKLSSQREPSQSEEQKKAPSLTPFERRPYQVEEQKAPDNVVESVIEKIEEPTPKAPESELPTQVTEANIEKTQMEESKVSAASVSGAPEPTPENIPTKSEEPSTQSAMKPTQSEKPRMQSVTLKHKAETASSTPSKSSSKPTKDSTKAPDKVNAQTASRITLPESFQTETMADIFMRQGLNFEAAEILRKLHTRNPSDRLKTKLEEAESGRVRK